MIEPSWPRRSASRREPEVAPLAGGAGRREMWSLTAGGRPPRLPPLPGGRRARRRARCASGACWSSPARGGVPVPEPVALTPTGIVVERVAGEARPQHLLSTSAGRGAVRAGRARRGGRRAAARDRAARTSSRAQPELSEPARRTVGAAPAEAAVATLERQLDRIGEPHPAIELGLRWLRANLPRAGAALDRARRLPALQPRRRRGRAAAADRLGARPRRRRRRGPRLDVRALMALRRRPPALGCGSREELLAAYAAAGGRAVSLTSCAGGRCAATRAGRSSACCRRTGTQRRRPLARAGDDRAPDLRGRVGPARAARRRPPATRARADAPGPPGAAELLETVAEYLRDLRSRAPAEDAFTLAVAANACRVVARELPPGRPGGPRAGRAARRGAAVGRARRRPRRARRSAARRGAGEARGR